MINHLKSFALVGLTLCWPASVLAQRSPDQVREAIEKAFKKEKITLRVDIPGGNAVLTGRVRNVFAKNKALEIALEQPEVEEVESNIEIAAAESDDKLGKEVVKELRNYGNFTIFDDSGAIIKDGRVVLMGFVTEPYKKTGLEKRLHKVLGIQEFDNQIQVLPNSMQDASLRRAIANRLYSDSTFSDFHSMSHPPIRIIVQRARVLLTGAVNNQMMSRKAELIIRQTPGVLSVENKLRIGN